MTAGLVVRYRNFSPYACTLSGYPTVIGLVSPAGPVQAATNVVNGVLGGWRPTAPGASKPLPTPVLSAKGGMASSVVESVNAGTAQSICPETGRLPLWFRFLWLDVPGGTRPFALAMRSLTVIVCKYFEASPIVPGTTGTALQVPH